MRIPLRRTADQDAAPLSAAPRHEDHTMEHAQDRPRAVPTAADAPAPNGHALRHRPFKGQATGSDVRAERMFRSVKTELDELRRTIDVIGAGQEEILEVSPHAVAENPSVAATLAPVVLVRSLVTAARAQERLERAVAEREEELNRLRAELSRLREEHARQGGRLETLDQVIGALHENLEDLRGERAYGVRQLAGEEDRRRLGDGRDHGHSRGA